MEESDHFKTSKFVLGNESLRNYISLVKGKRIGFIGNHTSLFENGTHLVQFLKKHAKVLTLFGPEHSFKGTVEDQKSVDSEEDNEGINVYSLFGEFQTPTKSMCSEVDLFIYDIQSVGVRFYTYICTLYNVLEACSRYNIELVVCDRPNPISGIEETISGPITRPSHCSFFSPVPLALRHSMTLGELALMFSYEPTGCYPSFNVHVRVLKMQNYERKFFFPSTSLKFVSCSPCMPDFETSLMYPGFCLFEGTNVSEGRGTTKPFLWIGAPWMENEDLLRKLVYDENVSCPKEILEGVELKNIEFVPESLESCTKPKYLGEKCFGLEVRVREDLVDFSVVRPVKLALFIMCRLKEVFGDKFVIRKFVDGLFGSEMLRSTLSGSCEGNLYEDLIKFCEYGVENFKKMRRKYLLYK